MEDLKLTQDKLHPIIEVELLKCLKERPKIQKKDESKLSPFTFLIFSKKINLLEKN